MKRTINTNHQTHPLNVENHDRQQVQSAPTYQFPKVSEQPPHSRNNSTFSNDTTKRKERPENIISFETPNKFSILFNKEEPGRTTQCKRKERSPLDSETIPKRLLPSF
ncbi:hypothetical protein DPMN_100042 [Dreissena polymorpha]|uniref:Uncharacterized protein n=1 Tax=Dreissena polymorpha TaxID=45954 RepID=A0A9D4LF75_DREPO|nr:hypothetical protein DPMN_100042 [Dreissena polymorpha]